MGSTLVYQKNNRNLSIEILRILSMFLIVLYHFWKSILFISPSTFGIYLIHTHPGVANFFYSLFNFSEYQDTVYKIFFVICLSILFYFVSMFIDII